MADIMNFARASRGLPQSLNEGDSVPLRTDRYGDQNTIVMVSKQHALADEGSYFVVTNPTPGTGIATIAAQASLADTAPFILVTNSSSGDGSKRIYLDYLRLQPTAAGTAGTAIRWAVKTDSSMSRYSSGGSALTPNNVNQDSGVRSAAVIQAGAIVASAATGSARLLGNGLFRPVIPVVADQYILNFGGREQGVGSLITSGTAIAAVQQCTSPVVIGPGQCAAIHIWLPSQSAASSYELELGYWER